MKAKNAKETVARQIAIATVWLKRAALLAMVLDEDHEQWQRDLVVAEARSIESLVLLPASRCRHSVRNLPQASSTELGCRSVNAAVLRSHEALVQVLRSNVLANFGKLIQVHAGKHCMLRVKFLSC